MDGAVIGRFETVDVRDAEMIEGCQAAGLAPGTARDLAMPPAPTRARTS
jgi:hypothetical protein